MISRMVVKIKDVVGSLLAVDPHERLKLLFLSLSYFFIVMGYTITRDLRDVVFASTVGVEYVPIARILSMIVLIAPLFLYSKLVDRLRRYQLLCYLSLFYGSAGLLFTYFLGHSSIGMLNTSHSAWRLIGWVFYFFIEGYTPFVVSVFWAFANSISNQEAAKKNYGLIVACSKVGGIIAAVLSIYLMSGGTAIVSRLQDVRNHQILLAIASVISLIVPAFIMLLMKKVPGHDMHGYEAVYKVEKQREKAGTTDTGIWSGVTMLASYPYVLGMFGIVFFYELINTVFAYQRILIADSQASSASNMSSFLYTTTLIMHLVGLVISLFGTRALIEKFGEKFCLMMVPAINFLLLLYFLINRTQFAFVVASVITKAVHYAFSYPLKESLYIPTIKEIKFKSKSWIDTFGSKFARTTGSFFNMAVVKFGSAAFFMANLGFLGAITGVWFVVAYFLGRRYERAIEHNEVIGYQPEENDIQDAEPNSELQ